MNVQYSWKIAGIFCEAKLICWKVGECEAIGKRSEIKGEGQSLMTLEDKMWHP